MHRSVTKRPGESGSCSCSGEEGGDGGNRGSGSGEEGGDGWNRDSGSGEEGEDGNSGSVPGEEEAKGDEDDCWAPMAEKEVGSQSNTKRRCGYL